MPFRQFLDNGIARQRRSGGGNGQFKLDLGARKVGHGGNLVLAQALGLSAQARGQNRVKPIGQKRGLAGRQIRDAPLLFGHAVARRNDRGLRALGHQTRDPCQIPQLVQSARHLRRARAFCRIRSAKRMAAATALK